MTVFYPVPLWAPVTRRQNLMSDAPTLLGQIPPGPSLHTPANNRALLIGLSSHTHTPPQPRLPPHPHHPHPQPQPHNHPFPKARKIYSVRRFGVPYFRRSFLSFAPPSSQQRNPSTPPGKHVTPTSFIPIVPISTPPPLKPPQCLGDPPIELAEGKPPVSTGCPSACFCPQHALVPSNHICSVISLGETHDPCLREDLPCHPVRGCGGKLIPLEGRQLGIRPA